MTIFTSTFEVGDTSEWTGTIGTPVIEGAPVHHGSWSCELNVGDLCYKTMAAVDEAYMRFYVNFSASNNANSHSEFAYLGKDWAYMVGVVTKQYGGVQDFTMLDDSTNFYDSGVPITLNQWYYVEIAYKKAVAGFYKLWIDGELKVNQAADTSAKNNVDRIMLGNLNFGGVTFTENSDCVIVDSAYIGPEAAGGPTVKKGSCVPAMTALLTKFTALKQPREPRFQPRSFPKFTPRALI